MGISSPLDVYTTAARRFPVFFFSNLLFVIIMCHLPRKDWPKWISSFFLLLRLRAARGGGAFLLRDSSLSFDDIHIYIFVAFFLFSLFLCLFITQSLDIVKTYLLSRSHNSLLPFSFFYFLVCFYFHGTQNVRVSFLLWPWKLISLQKEEHT